MTALVDRDDSVPFHPGLFEWPVPAEVTPRLTASHCPSCGRHAFPRKYCCPYCQNGNQDRVFLSGRGHIYAFAHVVRPPKIIGKPYVAAYVDLEERVRVFAQISDAKPADLHIGVPVRVDFRTFGTSAEGRSLVAYSYVLEK
jgi:uncharacterized OB-fold protein